MSCRRGRHSSGARQRERERERDQVLKDGYQLDALVKLRGTFDLKFEGDGDATCFEEAWKQAENLQKTVHDYVKAAGVLTTVAANLVKALGSTGTTTETHASMVRCVRLLGDTAEIASQTRDANLPRSAKRFIKLVTDVMDMNAAARFLLNTRKTGVTNDLEMDGSLLNMRSCMLVIQTPEARFHGSTDVEYGPVFTTATLQIFEVIKHYLEGQGDRSGYNKILQGWNKEMFGKRREGMKDIMAKLVGVMHGDPLWTGRHWYSVFTEGGVPVEEAEKGYNKWLNKNRGRRHDQQNAGAADGGTQLYV